MGNPEGKTKQEGPRGLSSKNNGYDARNGRVKF